MRFLGTAAPILAAAALAATGCRAYQINSTIENRTGSPIQLLEVDYPEASFGVDKMAGSSKSITPSTAIRCRSPAPRSPNTSTAASRSFSCPEPEPNSYRN